jgi:hypothetical protein
MAVMPPVELPIRVIGMEEFRSAIDEIKAAAADLQGSATINVTINIGETDVETLTARVQRELVRAQRSGW